MKCPACGCILPQLDQKGRCPDCGARLTSKPKRQIRPSSRKTVARPEMSIWMLFIVAFLLGGLFALREGLPATIEYYSQVKDRIVSVDAQITRISVWEDGEGDSRHDVYVRYTYDGQTYDDVEISRYHSGMRRGQTVTIKIDPQAPGKECTNPIGIAIIGVIFTTISSLGLWFFIIKPWTEYFKAKAETEGLR